MIMLMLLGTGFQSKGSYLFGHFSMHLKLVGGDSAGTVTAFYVSKASLFINPNWSISFPSSFFFFFLRKNQDTTF